MRRWIAIVACCIGCSSTETGDLEWETPTETTAIPVGDAIELAVATTDADTVSVRFEVDGTELAVCDPRSPDEDCQLGEVWRWTTVFATPGAHTISAIALDDTGREVARTTRTLDVVRELPADQPDDSELTGTVTDDYADDLAPLEAAGRGLLDPDRGWHSIFGGIQWRVVNQRVRLHNGTPGASVSDVARCMNRYGASIRRWADHYRISRASVVATALTESSCTNPSGSSDGLSSGPMQVTASTCSALTGLSRSTCRSRMHTNPDFSFKVGAKYMGSSYQKNQHKNDPPKIAAAYNAGSLRSTTANRWHMISTGNHIDRFVRWYNAYRSWELR